MTFLLAYLTAENDFEVVLSGKHQVEHFFPCCSLPPWRMGKYGVIMFLTLVLNISHRALEQICSRNLLMPSSIDHENLSLFNIGVVILIG